jgi:hypothetical protein
MMNPFTEVNWNPDRAGRRKFAVSLMIGFPCIAVLMLLARHFARGGWSTGPLWLAGIGFAFGLVCWLLPGISKPFYQAWYFIGCCLGFVLGNLLLSLFFYVVITPIGWLKRLGGSRSVSKGFDKSQASYWQPAEKSKDSSEYYRQF